MPTTTEAHGLNYFRYLASGDYLTVRDLDGLTTAELRAAYRRVREQRAERQHTPGDAWIQHVIGATIGDRRSRKQ